MKVVVDQLSGFCFGVTSAIDAAENELKAGIPLYSLGETVHNESEMKRLTELGLKVVEHDDFTKLSNAKVLIRAHGEPPETYKIAKRNGIELLDLTSPIVLRLQQNVRKSYLRLKPLGGKIIIYGKKGHAEVIGLLGQTENEGIVAESVSDIDMIDFSLPIALFSQTTKDTVGFRKISMEIEFRMKLAGNTFKLESNNTICRIMSNREPMLRQFATRHDVIIFVSGHQSSNGKFLFSICRETNPNSYFISDTSEIKDVFFRDCQSAGICGATSTPRRLLEEVAEYIRTKY